MGIYYEYFDSTAINVYGLHSVGTLTNWLIAAPWDVTAFDSRNTCPGYRTSRKIPTEGSRSLKHEKAFSKGRPAKDSYLNGGINDAHLTLLKKVVWPVICFSMINSNNLMPRMPWLSSSLLGW